MDDYTDDFDTYFDDLETKNNGLVAVEPDFQYTQLKDLCQSLLREVRRTRNNDEILRILEHKKQNYERNLGHMVSNEMYKIITNLINTHGTHGSRTLMYDNLERIIAYYNSILEEFREGKSEYVDGRALDDVTRTFDNMYNRSRPTPRRGLGL